MRKNFSRVKILRGVFPGDVLSSLLFVIVIIPLNYIHRKCSRGYKFIKLQDKINQLMYMGDINLSAKNEKALEILIQTIIYS